MLQLDRKKIKRQKQKEIKYKDKRKVTGSYPFILVYVMQYFKKRLVVKYIMINIYRADSGLLVAVVLHSTYQQVNASKQLIVSGLQLLFHLKVLVNCLNSLSAFFSNIYMRVVFLEESMGWRLYGGKK